MRAWKARLQSADRGTDMSETESFVCIGCPIGCPLQLTHEGTEIREITGHECNRGAKYARQEFTDPRRGMSTTVAIDGARWRRLPVKVTRPLPKDRVLEAARLIHQIRVVAPVRVGQILLEDLLGEAGVAVVATRSMARL
jgi:CxxC motif-containing protein